MEIVRELIASCQNRPKKILNARFLLISLALLFYFPAFAGIADASVLPKEITVVCDDNYPPFIFRDEKGRLQGILVDEWHLWAEKTGTKVNLRGMDWGLAQKTMAEGNADVIDTIFFTEERAKTLAFSAPYASLDVPIFFHKDISGLKDVNSLHGFTVGVKAGDACIDFLKRHGIQTLREYPSYESIVRDAAAQKIKVFCIDGPPAHYYLYKLNIEQQYRQTTPLYTGQFHRAVHKERKALLTAIEAGFAKISVKEREKIEKRWRGSAVSKPYLAYLFYLIGGLVILGVILLLWNYILHRKVTQKTLQLQETIDNLEKSEGKYKELFESIPDAFYRTDNEGLLVAVSPSAEQIFGYVIEESLGKNLGDFYVNPGERDHFLSILREQGEVKGHEAPMRAKDGSTVWVSTNAQFYRDKQGNILGVQGIARDITERKRAEEENRSLKERLQRAEKMEALGTLAGGVAHDLNNVLGVIVGYSELLLESVDKSSPLRHSVQNVMNGGMKAAAIVDDLLTLARRGVQGRSIVNLNQIVADCNKSPELENLSAHHLAVKIQSDLGANLLNISGSPLHLGKTIYNLISNAVEAMPTGGIVSIKTRNQYLDKPLQDYDNIQEGDYVALSVSDTGEGIAKADLRRIFEPFYTKKIMGRSGTGLGLAVVWGTVKDHNGYINVQSEAGKGSVFTLYFPVTREEISTEASAATVSEYMGKGETILVMDDVKEQRELASNMLKTLNYQVASAASGEDAVAYIKEHEVNLLVLDMIMDPGMDGLDAYKSILTIRPQQRAVIVSGFSESERVLAAKKLGAGAYVRKPYIKEKLGLAVRKELDRPG
ncbi:MAG: transporter substrate-binding domain-containing protein [Syntrophales bacterium]|jgi:PAS domain S-box-containing protein|nr:transporter substrate-binding domain-containing protein [Syntrophales bacterium]